MTQPCPRCKERGTEGQLMKGPGDTVASCLQCGYETVDIVSKPLPRTSTKWYCRECDKYLRGQKWFDKHMMKFHHPASADEAFHKFSTGFPSDTPPLNPERKQPHERDQSFVRKPEPIPFICPICQKPFDKKIQLDGHMATHSERPTDSMGVLEQAEKVLRKNIVASMDGQKDKLKEARRHVLEAIEVLL